MNKGKFNRLIDEGSFAELFITEMGWNNPTGPATLPRIEVDSMVYNSRIIAVKSGYKVLLCEVDSVPTTSVCRRIDMKVRRFANDYILIFVQRNDFHHLWMAPVRNVDKRDIVTTEYTTVNQTEFLYQKIDNLSFAFDETVTIVDVRQRVQESFAVNSEKITKDFYAGFKKEHKAFVDFIHGIEGTDTAVKDRQWYASVMLNRLMFCYFIQKKGFLDCDSDYLKKKLEWVKRERGEGHFFRSFYLGFLRGMFHDGLNMPSHEPEFENKYGRIPYLNGGMFDEHQIERDYADIDIADEAFERLFNFFDKWNWHLDTRITASGRDINPDVLGYIFEQYINDRAQMGAYYTKEDITEYIGRNCILPYLFDQVKNSTADSAKEFCANGYVWRSLSESGDKYIFDAVKKGFDIYGQIPERISRGIITEEMRKEYAETPIGELPEGHIPLSELRKEWNTRTPEDWGLPNEIWRETIERLQRCGDILGKINRGEITSINDFITYNLDIRSFATDLIAHGDSRFVGWFYHALQRVTILDPTCGSGAFLFAAMNILEPLYEICIDRMQEFSRENPAMFKAELAEITDKYRSNIQYFIFKSIILRNLYGVDIMVEATEIAKLRLFLKMVSVVDVDRRADNLGLDPLPDIDFNIRCGNTLVGYANKEQLEHDLGHAEDILQELANQDFRQEIEEELRKVARAYEIFKDVQLRQAEDMLAFKQAKQELRKRLSVLNDKLNRRLFIASSGYRSNDGIDFTASKAYSDWLSSHQPFHWLAEFYQIIEGNQGFDVIIGNPPYVVYTKKDSTTNKSVSDQYKVEWCKTIDSNNLYVFTLERSLDLSSSDNIGFIVPLSFGCGKKNSLIRFLYKSNKNLYLSSYEIRPAKLFDGGGGAEQRLNIVLSCPSKKPTIFSTNVLRWNNDWRKLLFTSVFYKPSLEDKQIWRFSSDCEMLIKAKFDKQKNLSSQQSIKQGELIHYRSAGLRYWIIFSNSGFNTESASNKTIGFATAELRDAVFCALSSSLYWWYYSCNFDMFNQTLNNIEEFRFNIELESELLRLASLLEKSQKDNRVKSIVNKKDGSINESFAYNKKMSKPIIDEIDKVLARLYGFTDKELDFIINYEIKYRMGEELNNIEE